MIRSRTGAKALVLCGLVLGLMAFASSAQAEPLASWGFKKTATSALEKFSKALEAQVKIEIEKETTASLLFTTGGGTKVTILCTTAEFVAGGTLSAEGSILPGKIKFSGCDTLLNGVLSNACKPIASVADGAGTILTETDHALIVLHVLAGGEKDDVVLILPAVAGGKLANILLGEECSIGEEVPVTGHLTIWDCKGNTSFLTHTTTHLIAEFPGLHGMKALGQAATLDGSAIASLTGAHAGYLWAGLPG
jgi:hypothetical protein